MRKGFLLTGILVVSALLCISTSAEQNIEGKWEPVQTVDEFGDATGGTNIAYITEGTFSNTATVDDSLNVAVNYNPVNKEFSFRLLEYDDTPATYYDNSSITIKYKVDDTIYDSFLFGSVPNGDLYISDQALLNYKISEIEEQANKASTPQAKKQIMDQLLADDFGITYDESFPQHLFQWLLGKTDVRCIIYIDNSQYKFTIGSNGFEELLVDYIEEDYQTAISLFEEGKYEEAKDLFNMIISYKDSNSYYENCDTEIEDAEASAIYHIGEKASTYWFDPNENGDFMNVSDQNPINKICDEIEGYISGNALPRLTVDEIKEKMVGDWIKAPFWKTKKSYDLWNALTILEDGFVKNHGIYDYVEKTIAPYEKDPDYHNRQIDLNPNPQILDDSVAYDHPSYIFEQYPTASPSPQIVQVYDLGDSIYLCAVFKEDGVDTGFHSDWFLLFPYEWVVGSKLENNASNDTNTAENSTYSDSETIKRVQEALNSKGYDCGTPDGDKGPKTTSVIQQYQTDNGLDATGEIDDALLSNLGIQ